MNIRKLLIANRGEIARRIVRAAQEMGIRTVAVYSDADATAPHVLEADEAVRIGPPPVNESYLRIDAILAAAQATDADAIHPGYGFLAENANFARAVRQAGRIFVGPPPEAIEAMGDKAAARRLMQAAGVPVVPGYQGPDDDASLRQAAASLGYPVLLKAAAGGGGKGMRIVQTPEELAEAAAAARREAEHAFGDPRLILEKYIPRARHVEVQILADSHGQILHLYERECSVQRRYQKIIEETPSPFVDEELRQRMTQAARKAAQAVGYVNAGTVEFIVDPRDRSFYFLEMNTRLQVEHPITEALLGLDLVQWQLRIAAGEKLPWQQPDLQPRGHAIEARVYAEDPATGFLPSTGQLLAVHEPQRPGVRVDSGVRAGLEVTAYYDPLLAKIIAWAETREQALARLRTALRQTSYLGVVTNIPFLLDVLAHPDFRAGQYFTRWVDEALMPWSPEAAEELPAEVLAALALARELGAEARPGLGEPASEQPGPWYRLHGWWP
ncbi:MAG: acetyl-CoA carboxylase biotin carboxylase subunit [Chloroflexi bacterium]|nr:acetyl-CoA carboxylase biotin carboxylase subunit [Chloroflexota bacterium]